MGKNKKIEQKNKRFLKELEQLNQAQRLAVETIEGPVMVVAGPGTGKTHMLAARIGNILIKTDTAPNNILCLTYTDAGEKSMRKKLLEWIGPTAHQVHIFTFHSFCNMIIHQFPEFFGFKNWELITELDQIKLVRKLLLDLPPTHPLKKNKAQFFYFERHLINIFNTVKMQNWEINNAIKEIEKYIQELPTHEDFIYKRKTKTKKKGDLKEGEIKKETKSMQNLIAALRLYPTYQKSLEATSKFEYSDMILWVINALKKEDYLVDILRERYLYFMVDEYQDTNASQNEIIYLLAEYWDNPNVFVVGDDDQAIYEFQGANIKNLIKFYKKFEAHISIIVNKTNYRSNQRILDASLALIENNQLRLSNEIPNIDKNLIAHDSNYFGKVKLLEFDNPSSEIAYIIQNLEEKIKKNIPLENTAILYAKHAHAENLIRALNQKKISYDAKKPENVLKNPKIEKFIQLLSYLSKEFNKVYSADYLLFELLHASFLKISPKDLVQIAIYLQNIDYKERPYWRKVLESNVDKFSLEKPDSILSFVELIYLFNKATSNNSLIHTVEILINKSGLLHEIYHSNEKIHGLNLIHSFISFIKTEIKNNKISTIHQLLETIDIYNQNRISVPIIHRLTNRKGVQLITAHSSKGLEFNDVFILNANKKKWESNKSSGNNFKLPNKLNISRNVNDQETQRRLFFVAMTRAKNNLFIGWNLQNSYGKSINRSTFIDEILQHQNYSSEHIEIDIEDLALLTYEDYSMNKKPSEVISKDKISAILSHYKLSASGFNTYLNCPLSFYYEQILGISGSPNAMALYGQSMHKTLQFKGKNLEAKTNQVLGFFKENFSLKQHFIHPEDYKYLLERGLSVLADFLPYFDQLEAKKLHSEYNIHALNLNGIPVTGSLDSVIEHKDSIEIIDYKTGEQSNKKEKKNNRFDKNYAIYYRQMLFYKLIASKQFRIPLGKISTKIIYLAQDLDNKFPEKEIESSTQEITDFKDLLSETWTKIKDQQFQGCGEKDCKWCQFENNYEAPDSFYNEINEII